MISEFIIFLQRDYALFDISVVTFINLLFQQPDQSDIEIPPKEKKFRGYFKIARHYKWALNQVFVKLGYSTAIIVEGTILFIKSLYKC